MNLIFDEKKKSIKDHLADIVIDRGDEETAHGGQGPCGWADEVSPILTCAGVTSLCEAATHPEPLGAASIGHTAL